jgi:hypothetical protein
MAAEITATVMATWYSCFEIVIAMLFHLLVKPPRICKGIKDGSVFEIRSPRRGEVFPEHQQEPSMSLRGQICSSTFLEIEDGSRSTSNLHDSWRRSGDLPEGRDGVVPHRVDHRDWLDELTRLHRSSKFEDGDDQFTEMVGLGCSGHRGGALPTPYLLSCEGPVFDRKFLHHARHLLFPGPPLFYGAAGFVGFGVRRA